MQRSLSTARSAGARRKVKRANRRGRTFNFLTQIANYDVYFEPLYLLSGASRWKFCENIDMEQFLNFQVSFYQEHIGLSKFSHYVRALANAGYGKALFSHLLACVTLSKYSIKMSR